MGREHTVPARSSSRRRSTHRRPEGSGERTTEGSGGGSGRGLPYKVTSLVSSSVPSLPLHPSVSVCKDPLLFPFKVRNLVVESQGRSVRLGLCVRKTSSPGRVTPGSDPPSLGSRTPTSRPDGSSRAPSGTEGVVVSMRVVRRRSTGAVVDPIPLDPRP